MGSRFGRAFSRFQRSASFLPYSVHEQALRRLCSDCIPGLRVPALGFEELQ